MHRIYGAKGNLPYALTAPQFSGRTDRGLSSYIGCERWETTKVAGAPKAPHSTPILARLFVYGGRVGAQTNLQNLSRRDRHPDSVPFSAGLCVLQRGDKTDLTNGDEDDAFCIHL